jgi:hypothetical protein
MAVDGLSDGLRSGLTTKREYERDLTVPPTLLSIADDVIE